MESKKKKEKISQKSKKEINKNENNNVENSEADSEDDELLIRSGRIPRKWYEDFSHLGYDINAKKIQKQKQGKTTYLFIESKIEQFIKKAEDPNWWRTVRDELNNKDIVLTNEQLNLLKRIRKGKYAKRTDTDDYYIEFEWNEGIFPLSAAPLAKRNFLPSKWERIKINKLVQAIKLGRINLNKPEKPKENIFDIWESSESTTKSVLNHISAPKMALPGHAESYNPSEEYLFDENETKQWLEADPDERENNFLPKKFERLRKVEAYPPLINERFERCLDLYLCPRLKKKKLNVDPDSLFPNLPNPQSLRPFPTSLNIRYEGHSSQIISLSTLHNGHILASCDKNGEVILWEITTTRILQRVQLQSTTYLEFSEKGGLLAVSSGDYLTIINSEFLPSSCFSHNEMILEESQKSSENTTQNPLSWEWTEKETFNYEQGIRLRINCKSAIKFISFHKKGDYIVTVSPKAEKKSEILFVHCLSKGTSQSPFKKLKGEIEKAVFHPNKPFLFIMTRKNTYIYSLLKQNIQKKLISGAQWNSCIALHPKGDNLLIGSHDKRVLWFDLDLSETPYKTLKYHEKSVKQVSFHNNYPLFASCSEDGSINVFHGKVFADLLENALIVPLKVLKVPKKCGIEDIKWHPSLPWIFSTANDNSIILWT